jgi:dTDP-4-amino-4,6-dideoxygalactose transaminase
LDIDRTFLGDLLDEQVLAIIPTHLYGLAQDVSDLVEIGRKLEIYIIEDAAQSFGATIHGQMVGGAGDFGFFSLGRGKCVPAGHGGVIIASDRFVPALGDTIQEMIPVGVKQDLASLFRFMAYALATTPLGWWFIVRSPMNPAEDGMNINALPPINFDNFSSTQAGIALSILARLDQINATRRRNAQRLMAVLCDYEFVHFPEIASDSEPVFLRLPIILDKKQRAERLYHMLSKVGIGVSRSYFRTLPALFTNEHAADARGFASADHLADCLLTLPTHSYLRTDDFMRIQNVFESIEL